MECGTGFADEARYLTTSQERAIQSRVRLRALGPLLCAATLVAAGHGVAASSDGDWPMPAKDYASTRYSNLADITTRNASTLKLALTFSTGVLRGHEAAPIVVAGNMYIITPYPNVVYALDLGQPGAPLRWKFEPRPEAFAQGVACCDVWLKPDATFAPTSAPVRSLAPT